MTNEENMYAMTISNAKEILHEELVENGKNHNIQIDRWSDKKVITMLTRLNQILELTETGTKWKLIKSEMKHAEIQETMDGDKKKSLYLGSVMNLAPSGKYYLPYACSNVDACKVCGGRGSIGNPFHNLGIYNVATLERTELTDLYLNKLNLIANDWPGQILQRCKYLDNRIMKHHITMTCPWCQGVGSREAKMDEEYFELLDQEAEDHGFYIESGEGDPTDVFVCESIE